MTLGAIARLIVKDPKVLNDETIHRIPSMMMVERLKLEKTAEKGGK